MITARGSVAGWRVLPRDDDAEAVLLPRSSIRTSVRSSRSGSATGKPWRAGEARAARRVTTRGRRWQRAAADTSMRDFGWLPVGKRAHYPAAWNPAPRRRAGGQRALRRARSGPQRRGGNARRDHLYVWDAPFTAAAREADPRATIASADFVFTKDGQWAAAERQRTSGYATYRERPDAALSDRADSDAIYRRTWCAGRFGSGGFGGGNARGGPDDEASTTTQARVVLRQQGGALAALVAATARASISRGRSTTAPAGHRAAVVRRQGRDQDGSKNRGCSRATRPCHESVAAPRRRRLRARSS